MSLPISRRSVLRLIGATAAGAAVHQATAGLAAALTAPGRSPALIWLAEGVPDHSLLTLLGQDVPRFLELVTVQWDLLTHASLFDATPDAALPGVERAPILVLERSPHPSELAEAEGAPLRAVLAQAKAVVLLGTDACYGGLTGTAQGVTSLEKLCRSLKTPLIKLPGLPPPPQHLVGVIAHLEFFGFPVLDAHGRPLLYYGEPVCKACEFRADLDAGRFAATFGASGCLLQLGCKGVVTHNSCSAARWNGGVNWCVGAGGPCVGCSEPTYPDHGGVGLYGALASGGAGVHAQAWGQVERVGYAVLALAAVGIGLRALRRWLMRDDPAEEG